MIVSRVQPVYRLVSFSSSRALELLATTSPPPNILRVLIACGDIELGVTYIVSLSVLLVVGGALPFPMGLLEWCVVYYPRVNSIGLLGVVVMSTTYFMALGSVGF